MDHFNRFKSVFIYFILNAAGQLPKPANIKIICIPKIMIKMCFNVISPALLESVCEHIIEVFKQLSQVKIAFLHILLKQHC